MLRRLGLRAEENGHNASRSSITSSDSGSSAAAPVGNDSGRKVVVAPAVDYDRPTKYFKVVYRGSVGVRSCPTEPAPPDGQVSAVWRLTKHGTYTENNTPDNESRRPLCGEATP